MFAKFPRPSELSQARNIKYSLTTRNVSGRDLKFSLQKNSANRFLHVSNSLKNDTPSVRKDPLQYLHSWSHGDPKKLAEYHRNQTYYFENRDNFIKEYGKGSRIVICHQKVFYVGTVATADLKYVTLLEEGEIPFITYLGYEHITPEDTVVGVTTKTMRKAEEGVLIVDEDVPPKLWEDWVTLKKISDWNFPTKYFGISPRIYGCIPLRRPKYLKSAHEYLPIWFLIDTGSPQTFLSRETIMALSQGNLMEEEFLVQTPGIQMRASLTTNHWKNTNLLGTDFIYPFLDLRINFPQLEGRVNERTTAEQKKVDQQLDEIRKAVNNPTL